MEEKKIIKTNEVKRGDIIRTKFGMMIVINADFSKNHLQGYNIATRGKDKNPLISDCFIDEVELFDDVVRQT